MQNKLIVGDSDLSIQAPVEVQSTLTHLWARLRSIGEYAPGLFFSLGIAIASLLFGRAFNTSPLLPALLLGLAFHRFYKVEPFKKGVEITAKKILRIGIALLGLRITYAAVADLGALSVITIVSTVTLTILSGAALARLLGLKTQFGLLSGGAVAICGASAALALCAVMPRRNAEDMAALERDTLLVVIGVTTLSTIAMVTYPSLAAMLGLSETETGLFLGATIHDVAQVVGAGYGVSMEVGDVAVVSKLMRVVLLLPVALIFLYLTRITSVESETQQVSKGLVPGFLMVFVMLLVINSLGWVPQTWSDIATSASQFMLLMAMAAIGIKTSLSSILKIGARPIVLIVAETLFLAALAGGIIVYGDLFSP